ncbi:MAG TPA: bifunctional glutamate N-acetyltransferase/amino-acid acetyltransferase ArgJ [Candidatus Saccharimonadales bacterium]|nr:bifunctional glutamate N-acetyltransferase/amino-acid acetyltransferase ArgJ [Candidatus Saccharimonadales bacterium]
MKIIKGGLGHIAGFSSLGKHIGLKDEGKDFGVVYSDRVCNAAALYTQNKVQGAPLHVTRRNLADHRAQAIVVNSRIANVATGKQGRLNAAKTAEMVAEELGIGKDDVIVASTGVIGPQLPMNKIQAGIKGIKGELKPDGAFAEAILTTDTHKKEICVDAGGFKIAGVAKGSGMIEPNMATLLVFLITDADLAAPALKSALKTSADKTFNMTSVDTDTSTSDMAVLLANGTVKNVDPDKFQQALDLVCLELTKMIVRDGEGVSKMITCEVNGAKDEQGAKKVAKAVINSPLVKTAVYGNDPNWGRLMMAVGKSGADIEEEKITVSVNGEPIVENGRAAGTYDDRKLSGLFKENEEINFVIDLNLGAGAAMAYGCDMSEEYIKINAEYTT